MKIKGLNECDALNYKKLAMFIVFPTCDFKCDKENGCQLCQNAPLAHEPVLEMDIAEIYQRYENFPLTAAFVLGGLEPFDSEADVEEFVRYVRDDKNCNDDIVIYTGYTVDELTTKKQHLWNLLKLYPNIIVKVGRYKPNQHSHYDPILGVKLASDNQYGIVLGIKE